MDNKNKPLETSICDGVFTIQVGINTVKESLSFEDETGWEGVYINDVLGAMEDIELEMNLEGHIGETPLQQFFEDMAEKAMEQGSISIYKSEDEFHELNCEK